MSRVARIVLPAYPFHLTHRGNNKQKIFLSDDDRRKYLFWFEEARQKFDLKVLAYCLMDNHVHFIVIPGNINSLAKTIQAVHRKYAAYFNTKYKKSGHLWEGRYYSCLLDQRHLVLALRYVERNPVRALMVKNSWDWVWSSAREHLGKEKGYVILDNISLYVDIRSWKEFISTTERDADLCEIRNQTQKLKAWADEEFKINIERQFGVELLAKKIGRPLK